MTAQGKVLSRSPGRHARRNISPGLAPTWRWAGLCLMLIIGLLACVSYAAMLPAKPLNAAVDQLPPGVGLRNVYGLERNATGAYLWTKASALILLPVERPGHYRLTLDLQSSPDAGPRVIRVLGNGQLIGEALPDATMRSYTFDWALDPASWQGAPSELRVQVESTPYIPSGDDRPLGIILSRFALAPLGAPTATGSLLLAWLAIASGLLLLGQLVGLPWRWRGAILAIGVVAALVAVLQDRPGAFLLAYRPLLNPWLVFNCFALAAIAAVAGGALVRRPATAAAPLARAADLTAPAPPTRLRRLPWKRALDASLLVIPCLWALIAMVPVAGQVLLARDAVAAQVSFIPTRMESVQFVAIVFGYTLLGPLTIRLFRPSLTVATLVAGFAIGCAAFATGAGAVDELLLLIALGVAWCELGLLALVLLRVRLAAGWERGALAFALGSGLFALWIWLIGALGLFYLPVVAIPVAGLVASAIVRGTLAVRASGGRAGSLATWTGRLRWVPSWFETILLGQLLGFVLVGCASGFAPEVLSDAVRVHMVIARQYVLEHRVFAMPGQSLTYWPIHGQLLYATGILLRGPLLAKLIHTLTGLAVVVAVGAGGALLGRSRTAGIVAATLLASLPVFTWQLGVGYTDLFETLYSAVALLCLLRLVVSRDWRWSLLLGAMLGFGVAAKLRSGLRVFGTGLALGVGLLGRLRFRPLTRVAAACALGLALTGGIWVSRTIVITKAIPGISPLVTTLGVPSNAPPDPAVELLSYGIGRGTAAFLRLPWALSSDTSRFGENADGFVGFALLFLLPCLLALPRRRRVFAALAFVAVPYFLWYSTVQYVRYLLPTLAALATVLGAAAVFFARRLARYRAVGRLASRAYLATLSGVLLSSLVFYLATMLVYPGKLPVRVVLGQERPETYLASTLGMYNATRQLDALVAPGEGVAALPDGPELYTHARLITPFVVDPRLIWAPTIDDLLAVFKRYGVTYLMIDHAAIPPSWSGFWIVRPDFLATYTDRVYTSGTTTIYRLRSPGEGATGRELLQSPGFEDRQGRTGPWLAAGDTPPTASTLQAYRSSHALTANDRATYYQAAPVEGGRGYRLRYVARADRPGTLAELRIDWFNSAGVLLRSSANPVPVTTDWAEYSLWQAAPPGATVAVVYVQAQGSADCWFDDYSLRQVD